MSADGDILEESGYGNTSDDARKFARRVKAKYGPCKAVCESTGNHWIKTADVFESAGIPLMLANPFKIKAIAWASVKTDTADARTLAHLLRTGMAPACYIGSTESRGIKQVIRYEIREVQKRTNSINYLHSLTDKHDVDPTKGGSSIWCEKALKYIEGMRLKDPFDQIVLKECVSEIRQYNERIKNPEVEITRYVKSNPSARLLLSMTGIGVFAAALLSAEIDDITRFDSPKKLVSWAGACPTVHQSGDTLYHGRIKKDANRKVNWIIIQCAHVAVRYDDRMKEYYERLKKRHRSPVAITHVANKMLTIIWHMLTKKELYQGRKEKLYRSKIRKIMAV